MDTASIFDAAWSALTEARASLRRNALTVNCLCASIEISRENGEQGAFISSPTEARIKVATEIPANTFANGEQVEIQRIGAASWMKAKVMSRRTIGGVLSLTLGGIYE